MLALSEAPPLHTVIFNLFFLTDEDEDVLICVGTCLLKQEVIKSENKQAFPASTKTEALFLPSDTQTLLV